MPMTGKGLNILPAWPETRARINVHVFAGLVPRTPLMWPSLHSPVTKSYSSCRPESPAYERGNRAKGKESNRGGFGRVLLARGEYHPKSIGQFHEIGEVGDIIRLAVLEGSLELTISPFS